MSIEDAIKELESLSPSESAINMVLKYFKFYKDGLEREIENNRENIFEIINKDKIIDMMAEEIFIKRAYSINCEEYKEKLKSRR